MKSANIFNKLMKMLKKSYKENFMNFKEILGKI